MKLRSLANRLNTNRGTIQVEGREPSAPIPFRHQIDHFYSIQDRGFLIHGWIHDEQEQIVSIELASDAASSGSLIHRFIKMERPDVEQTLGPKAATTKPFGFVTLVPFDLIENQATEKLRLQFKLLDGETVSFPAQDREPDADWAHQLAQLIEENPEEVSLLQSSLDSDQKLEHLETFVRIAVDSAYSIADAHVYCSGWLVDAEQIVQSVAIKQGKTRSPDLLFEAARYARPDLEQAFKEHIQGKDCSKFGFSSVVPFEVEQGEKAKPLSLIVTVTGSKEIEVPLPAITPCQDTLVMSQAILGEIIFRAPSATARLGIATQAIELAWKNERSLRAHTRVRTQSFGPDVPNPEVTVIVPIYGRYDFIEYQMSQFALDPDFQRTELLYVIDDPSIYEASMKLCAQLFPIYRVPFRVIYAGENRGFAGANNLGAEHANASTLLLLNSDVMPKETGWLSRLVEAYEELESPGAIAPVLLYEDDSIQHYGMHFELCSEQGDNDLDLRDIWVNVHQYKGIPSSLLSGRKEPEEVPAVTAACLMISRSHYERFGGLDEGFILGDFEDSDLCLTALENGYRNYLIPTVQLYHLERQSQNQFKDLSWKGQITLVNCCRHTQKWGETIRKLQDKGDHG